MAIALATNHGESSNSASATTIAHALVGAAAANTRIILDVCWFGTQTIASVSGGGLTWVIDVQGAASGNRNVGAVSADCPAGLANGTTITVTFSAATTDRGLGASSWTGMKTGASGYLGIAPAVVLNGAGTAWSTGARTISAGSMLIGVTHEDSAATSSTPGAGVTELRDIAIAATSDGWTTGYRIEAAGGSFAVSGTWNASIPTATSTAYVEYTEAAGGTTNALAGTIASTSTITGSLTVTAPLAGTSAAASTLAGAITARAGLAGTIAGASTVTGAATVTAGLAGTITATSSLTGALTNTPPGGVPLAGTIAASSTLAGALTVTAPLAGTVAAASTLTGTLTVSAAGTNPLAGTIAGTSTITGALLVTKPLAGTVAATSTVTGTLTVTGGLAGTITASSTLTGALTVRHPLAGIIDTSSTLTGAITVLRLLSGQITAVSALTGTLTNAGPVTAVGRLEGGLSAVFGESTAASSVSESTSGVLALTE